MGDDETTNALLKMFLWVWAVGWIFFAFVMAVGIVAAIVQAIVIWLTPGKEDR